MLASGDAGDMKRITRTATEQALADLAERPAIAHLAYIEGGRATGVPVSAVREGDDWLVRAAALLPPGRAMLLVDDGVYYFDLRGLRYPGELFPAEPGAPAQRFVPEKAIGWHYGTLRERATREAQPS